MTFNLNDKEINIDKKYLIIGGIVVIALIVLLFFIPKTTKLKCTKIEEKYLTSSKEVYTATFKNNQLSTLVIDFTYTLDEDYMHMFDEVYDHYSANLEELKSGGGYKYKLEKGDDFIHYVSTINMNKIPNSTKDAVGFNNKWKYEYVKDNLEKFDFVCK